MKTITKALKQGTIGAVAAGAMAMTSATPAMARDRDGGIDAGDVIAGAVILGGIAAVAAAASNNRDRYRGDYRRGSRYDNRYAYRGGNPRDAVQRCVSAVENNARRAGYRFADVTEIRDVDDRRYGWRVKGRLVVDGNRGYGRYDTRYDRRSRYDNRRRADEGRFTCEIQRGRVVDIDYGGIRGLR